MSSYRPLHRGWTVAPVDPGEAPDGVPDDVRAATAGGPTATGLPAQVPGCVHTDLLAAGLIPDPYLDDNEVRLRWIGRTPWRYDLAFDWDANRDEPQVDLVCAGLDTVATVELNGVELGRTQNMHRTFRFPVANLLRPAGNRLTVYFDSAYAYTEAMRAQLGEWPSAYPEPINYIRKMACNFGWDWGPTLVTAGIWRPIGLQSWGRARLAEVRPVVRVDGGTGKVAVHVTVERAPGERVPLVLKATVAGAETEVRLGAEEDTAIAELTVDSPELWWPRAYGDQPRYPLQVNLQLGDGRSLDCWERQIGFRTVRWDTTPDEFGTPFTLYVNDVPVFVKGVNWIPDDAFLPRVTRARYAERFDQAIAAGVNYLRIWGGGCYESDDFYDLADEKGLLVQQDFLFACATYPEEGPFPAEVAAEAHDNVVRLAPHPSLVLWTGNNENIWGHADWDWQEPLAGRSWGAGYYFQLLPEIVSTLDPSRQYWPGSPYSGSDSQHPNSPEHGTMHIWDVWNTHDYSHYRAYQPRFVAEFGYQGPPVYATIARAIHDDPLAPDSPGMRHHQKAIDGDLKLQRGLDAHLPKPRDFADWLYLTQLNQARAIQLAIEYFRSLRPRCMGTIVWQLNDCWPVTSWAAVDGDGRLKPMWHALRRAYADRLLTLEPVPEGGLILVAVNDGAEEWVGEAAVRRLTLTGEVRAKTSVPFSVPARGAVRVALPPDLAVADEPTTELVVADDGSTKAWWFFAEDKDIPYPKPEYDAAVRPVPGGAEVTVTARALLRDVALFPDRLDPAATVDEALVTLLPGDSVTFRVSAPSTLDPDALVSPPVLRCVNDIR